MITVSFQIACELCGKSFHIDSKTVFSSAMLFGFGVYNIPLSDPSYDSLWIERLNYKRELQFNYLFSLKNVYLSSNNIIFECSQILQ